MRRFAYRCHFAPEYRLLRVILPTYFCLISIKTTNFSGPTPAKLLFQYTDCEEYLHLSQFIHPDCNRELAFMSIIQYN